MKPRRSVGRRALAPTILLTLCASATAETRFVDDSATGVGDGSSWKDAFVSLQDALSAAVPSDEIWVAEGVYRPDRGTGQTPGDRLAHFLLRSGVGVYGGFIGTETDRDQRLGDRDKTTLSGDLAGDDGPGFANYSENSFQVTRGTDADENAILDGFTITGGNADQIGVAG